MPKNPKMRATPAKVETRDATGPVTIPEWQQVLSRQMPGRVEVCLESSLGVATFQQGVNLIARKIAETPVVPMRRIDDGGWKEAEDYPTYRLLRFAPNTYQNSFTFWAALLSRAVATGLGLAEIVREGGRVAGFRILDNAQPRFDLEQDRVVYQVRGREYDARDCLEVRGLSFDGVHHHSPVDLAAAMLETRISEVRYQSAVYRNGAGIKGLLTVPTLMDEEQAAQMASNFAARQAGPDNAGRPPVLSGGMDWKPTEHSPADTEVVDSAKFGVSEVARLLNLPGWIVNAPDAVKPANNEEAMAQFAVLTLSPWFTAIQQELDFKCVAPGDWGKIEHRFNTHNLVKADAKTLADMAIRLSEAGIITKNDGREMMSRSPIDNPLMNSPWIGTNNQAPILSLQWGETTQPAVNRPLPAPIPPDEDDGEATRALAGLLADPLGRFAANDANALRRLAGRDRFDHEAEAHFRAAAPKLAQALAPAARAVRAVRGLDLDPEAIARAVADAALAELRPLWQTHAPAEIAPHLEKILANWPERATSLAGRLVLEQGE